MLLCAVVQTKNRGAPSSRSNIEIRKKRAPSNQGVGREAMARKPLWPDGDVDCWMSHRRGDELLEQPERRGCREGRVRVQCWGFFHLDEEMRELRVTYDICTDFGDRRLPNHGAKGEVRNILSPHLLLLPFTNSA
jgi:hypothetical protein